LSKKKATPEEVALTLGYYVRRWQRWISAWLSTLDLRQREAQAGMAANLDIQVSRAMGVLTFLINLLHGARA